MRLTEARKDYYRRRAREEGYPSRAAFKLIQIDDKYHLLRRGSRVLDLGCAPGGWSQVACERVGPGGLVVGVDIERIEFRAPNFRFVRADIGSGAEAKVLVISKQYDCLLSDLAPNAMGIWEVDCARQLGLTGSALDLGKKVLPEGGSAVFKLFQGEGIDEALAALRGAFQTVVISKPQASRKQASEVYAVCLSFKRA